MQKVRKAITHFLLLPFVLFVVVPIFDFGTEELLVAGDAFPVLSSMLFLKFLKNASYQKKIPK
jgi:hypothetical protein